ncbi:MAG: cytochrome b5 domain-containing protein [Proteobacteria bacterium]|nr:cytochrome b5 domain-containing protein [Pseudomonadota bacterium]
MDKQKVFLIVIGSLFIIGLVFYFFKASEDKSNEYKSPVNQITQSSKEKCIITVRGSKYDVTEFRNMHQGGDIFECGQDMTDKFNNQHGEREFKKLQKYKITE